jgi:ketohexokinase
VEELSSKELVDVVASFENTESITWIHFEGRIPEVLRAAIPSIRKLIPHAAISIEFEKPDRPGLNDLLPLADIAFFSHTYYSHSQHSSPTSFFASTPRRNSSAALILMVGKEGAYYFSKMYGEGHVSAPSVDVVDATGAGDTFIGGFIWAFGKMRRGLEESVGVAVNLASRKVSQEGFDSLWTT